MAGPGKVFEDIKAKIYDKFIQYFVITRGEVIDQPGFILCRFTSGSYDISLREFVFPESLFCELESAIVKKYGDKGKQALYSAGKKFGYRYAKISGLATIAKSGEKRFKKELYDAVRYMETIYAEGIRHIVDLKKSLFEASLNQYVVCRLNGLGYLLTEGSVAGTLAYMLDNKDVEGTQIQCQGRGDKLCKLICAPKQYLKNKKIAFLEENDYTKLELSIDYPRMNAVRQCKFATQSFKSLVDSGFYKYEPGVAKFGNERYLFCESSIWYLIEIELGKLGANGLIFDVAFETGKKVGKEHKRYGAKGFLTDYLSSLGYGDVQQLSEREVSIDYFPWTRYVDEIQFDLLRGLVSGLLSGLTGKEIKLRKVEYREDDGFLSIAIK